MSTVKTRLYQGLSVLRKQLRDAGVESTFGRWVESRWGEKTSMCDSKELLVSFLYNEIDPAGKRVFDGTS